MKQTFLLGGVALSALIWSGTAMAANCPSVTMADMQGLKGAYPQQFEKAEFEKAANCQMGFAQNPDLATLNSRLIGNPEKLAPVVDRLPVEPLVVVPLEKVGKYGGTLNGLSNATEAGTSDLLSVRHVNLTRFSNDLQTIKPNVAKSFSWNKDFTELTFVLRKGHKWSDGAAFTSEDVAFWLNNLILDEKVVGKVNAIWKAADKPMQIEVMDAQTFKFVFAAPNPGFLPALSQIYAQPFQPKHFLGQFHPKINPDADKLAQEAGFKNGYEVIAFYYGGSDWKDVPSPYLRDTDKIKKLPAAVVPTLESHIVVQDSPESRHLVANPYYHVVDTAGNQLPYISEIHEDYVPEKEVRILKQINGEIDYKSQANQLEDTPTLMENQEKGKYKVYMRPRIALPVFSFNQTANDTEKRAVFSDQNFVQAMSHAINRDDINKTTMFDLGKPRQYLAFDPVPDFASKEQVAFATSFDQSKARALLDAAGLKDQDGDGFRDLPSGQKLSLNLQFTTQFVSSVLAEMVAQSWTDVGIQTAVKEVTTDEYRAAQSANELDIMLGLKGRPAALLQGNSEYFEAPFDDYFGPRNGMLWQRYLDTDGKEGVKPPKWTEALSAKVTAWKQTIPGSADYQKLGSEIIDLQLANMMFIGTVESQNLIYRSDKLQNFDPFKTWSYEYYRTYPYHADQWWLTE